MEITSIETVHCPAGWRQFHFVRLSTSDGTVGWSEYDDGFAGVGVTAAINSLKRLAIGSDVFNHERLYSRLAAASRQSLVGVLPRAIGAIENAVLDAKAKALGVPCYELLGGKVRDQVRVYWSHCGTWRIGQNSHYGNAVKSLQDVRDLGSEVVDRGFSALKTNIFRETPDGLVGWSPGFGGPAEPGRTPPRQVLDGLSEFLFAFREGVGPDVDILLDLNFNARTEGYLSILRRLREHDLFWIEIDTPYPKALATIRQQSPFTISGCESLTGLVEFLPYFENEALDVAIIDAMWIGIWQSMKIASAADAFQVNVAPHNYYGHLSTLMSAHFCSAVPNLKIMETDIDRVPSDQHSFTHEPEYVDGFIIVPDRPGWGTEPVESVLVKD